MKTVTALLFFLFFIVVILSSGCSSTERLDDGHEATTEHLEEHEEEEFHIHVDFKVYINDRVIDFSNSMYHLKAKSVHVEDGIGELVHVHKEGVTIGDFFETLDIEFNKTCIIIPIEGSYCNVGDKRLSFYVNGIENEEFESYETKDLDKILVSYGEGDIKEQLDSITSLAAEG